MTDRYRDVNQKNEPKKTTPRKAFAKFFIITFVCCVVGITAGLGVLDGFLGQKPMEKAAAETPALEPVEETEEKLNILIPAEGTFKKDSDFKDSKRVNILLFGNTIDKNEAYGLTDTIMLGSFDPDTKKFDVISVPRDTYYEREDYAYGGYLKINSVMETEGVKGAAESVHEVLQGVQINYYAVINYDGAAKIIDSIGGVPMDVPLNMHYTDAKQNLYINLKKGKQTLDGEHAIQFLRYRHGYKNGDIGRVEAQQKFVRAAVKESMGLNLPKVAQTVMENVDSDLDIKALLYLASKAIGMSGDDLNAHMLPGGEGRVSGLSFWVPADNDEVIEMMREVYTGIPQTTEGAISSSAVDEGEEE
ncbi:MAG: LCP family protein [Clostridiales Family XIII bacterium]|nr:LCP family protein [Clostridiales Family XIII bacterium]